MQHIVHVFIDEEQISFRNLFSSIFRQLNPKIDSEYFTSLVLSTNNNGDYSFDTDLDGDKHDEVKIEVKKLRVGIENYFDSLYSRKVTVTHQGNNSMVIMLWARLYNEKSSEVIIEIVNALKESPRGFKIEVCGFTNDAVSCFIPELHARKSTIEYKALCDRNRNDLKAIRSELQSIRLIANANINGVSLNLTHDDMARICAEFSTVMSHHYLSLRSSSVVDKDTPFESFGISTIKFDREYYHDYILSRLIIDKLENEGINSREFLINQLATSTNPVFQEFLKDVDDFHGKQVLQSAAALQVTQGKVPSNSNLVAQIDKPLSKLVGTLREKVDKVLQDSQTSIFKKEAYLSLILGDDSEMFQVSAVNADEITIEQVEDRAVQFYVNLDEAGAQLFDVGQTQIMNIRRSIRNIAAANRERAERLNAISTNITTEEKSHFNDSTYQFEKVDYQVNVEIDSEPLETTYEPHPVNIKSLDLSPAFCPIKNQGAQGSCSAFAISSVVEMMRKRDHIYSPAFLYWHARNSQGQINNDTGASLYSILKVAKDKGVCVEDLFPYDDVVLNKRPSEDANSNASKCKVLEAQTVNVGNVNAIKSALADGYPVIIAAKIFNSFSETRKGFVPHPSESEENLDRKDGHGNHAMVVCGFSDEERVFKVRNSWGESFGDNGYCYIPYSYAEKYFLQACIISAVSPPSNESEEKDVKYGTINFNKSDAYVEAAILHNLIAEDNKELEVLNHLSDDLHSKWSQNCNKLVNVNIQRTLVNTAQESLADLWKQKNEACEKLNKDKPNKEDAYIKSQIKTIVFSFLFVVIFGTVSYFLRHWATITCLSISVVIFCVLLSKRYWSFRKYRQDLRDEINAAAIEVSNVEAKIKRLSIDSHIYGTLLKEIYVYKQQLYNELLGMKAFNEEALTVYDATAEKLKYMQPSMPYPLLSVLNNNCLSNYYSRCKDKMLSKIDLKQLSEKHSADCGIWQMLANSPELERSIYRRLDDFSLYDYIENINPNAWPFLPPRNQIGANLQNLDSRALPFIPYVLGSSSFEKYLVINAGANGNIKNLDKYFTQAPCHINCEDRDSISVLNIMRFG